MLLHFPAFVPHFKSLLPSMLDSSVSFFPSPLRTSVLRDSRSFFQMKSLWNPLSVVLSSLAVTWVASRGRPLAGGKLTSGYCELACLCISCVHRPAVLSTPTCVGNSSTSPEFAPMSVRLSRSSTQWPRLCKVRKSPSRAGRTCFIWDERLYSWN